MSGHGRRNDETSCAALLEVVADGLSAVEGSIEIGLDDLVPGLDRAVQNTAVSGPASIGNKGINLSKLLDDLADEFGDIIVVAHVALVSFDLDAVRLAQLLGVLLSAFGTGRVGDSEVGTHFGTATSSFDAHAFGTGCSGHDNDFAFEAEQIREALGLGDFDRHDD